MLILLLLFRDWMETSTLMFGKISCRHKSSRACGCGFKYEDLCKMLMRKKQQIKNLHNDIEIYEVSADRAA
jgi:hypothetical protein